MVDGTALEMRSTRKGIGGSNPSLSAIPFSAGDTSARVFRDSEANVVRARRRRREAFDTDEADPALAAGHDGHVACQHI